MCKDKVTGWELSNRKIFDEIVMSYEKVRWEYPDGLFADIIQYSGPGRGKI